MSTGSLGLQCPTIGHYSGCRRLDLCSVYWQNGVLLSIKNKQFPAIVLQHQIEEHTAVNKKPCPDHFLVYSFPKHCLFCFFASHHYHRRVSGTFLLALILNNAGLCSFLVKLEYRSRIFVLFPCCWKKKHMQKIYKMSITNSIINLR